MKPLCIDSNGRPFHIFPRDLTDEFAEAIPARHFAFYIEHRARGHHGDFCFTSIFGEHAAGFGESLRAMVEQFEALPRVRKAIEQERDSLSINQLWNPRIASDALRRTMHDPKVSHQIRLRAARERDVIMQGAA